MLYQGWFISLPTRSWSAMSTAALADVLPAVMASRSARMVSSSNGLPYLLRSTLDRNAATDSCDSPRYGGMDASPYPTRPSYAISTSMPGVVVREEVAIVNTWRSCAVKGRY